MIRELTELCLRLPPDPSSLASALERTANSGADLLASCSYCDRFGMVLMLVPAHPERLQQELRAAGFQPQPHPVIAVGPQASLAVGPLVRLQLAHAGIGILYSYASWTENGQGLYIFQTTDNTRARRLLQGHSFLAELQRVQPWHGDAARRLQHDPFLSQRRAA